MVLSDGWKLQRTVRPDETWHFHLRHDPIEQRNVAAQHPAEVEQLLALLAVHDAEQSEPA